MTSICDHSEDSQCYHTDHSSNICSNAHHYHHHHHHHHHQYHSESASWEEELKSVSSVADNYSSLSYKQNHHHYNKHYKNQGYQSEDLHANYNNPVLPFSATMKSIQSSAKTVDGKNRKKRLCFCCCRTRTHSRLTVFFFFSLCILGAFAAFFCWPRTPRVSMGGGADSLSGPPDWWNGERQPLPPADAAIPSRPSLRATWQINVTLDNRDNWVPTRVNQLDFVMVDSLTLAKFAWATSTPLVLPPGVITPVSLTFNVNYQAADRTDPTFQNLYNACGPINGSKQRPGLNIILRVSFHIFGITWTPLVTATPYTGGILCPTK